MQKYINREPREDGFTLIELLVVILIIGILSAIAIPAFMNQRKTASEASLKADLANAAKVYETHAIKNKVYPAKPADVDLKISQGNHIEVPASDVSYFPMRAQSATNVINVPFKMIVPAHSPSTASVSYIQNFTEVQSFRASITLHCDDGTSINSSVTLDFGPSYSSTTFKSLWFQSCANTAANPVRVHFYEMYDASFTQFNLTKTAAAAGPVSATDPKGFCIQGYSDAEPSSFWNYSSAKGGLKAGKCA